MAAATFPVTVHEYEIAAKPGRFAYAYEFTASSPRRKNALVVIGGLGGGPHTLRYPRMIAKRLEADAGQLGFSVFEPRLRTSFAGFGYGSLAGDVADLDALVRYLRGIGMEKIVLMGHSTGCQVRIMSLFLTRAGDLTGSTTCRTAWSTQITKGIKTAR